MKPTALDQAVIREEIINAVVSKHGVTRADLISRSRIGKIAEARKDVAQQLKAAGFGYKRIGQMMNRHPSSICQIIKAPDRKEEKRLYKILFGLPADVRAVLEAMSQADNVSPQTIMREWIYERARFEAEAKARAAA